MKSMRAWNAVFRLPSAVWLLGLVSLCNDSASELVYPLVPLYLASVLMAAPRALGIIEGVAEATGSLLKLVRGALTDRTRSTKPWVIARLWRRGGCAAAARACRHWPMVAAAALCRPPGQGPAHLAARCAAGARGAGGPTRSRLRPASRDGQRRRGGRPAAGCLAAGRAAAAASRSSCGRVPGALTVVLALAIREPRRDRQRSAAAVRLDAARPFRRAYSATC